MKTHKLEKYSEDGVLSDVDDAQFLARKIGPEDHLDFSDIESVSPEFLDTLLDGHAPESLDGRINGQSDAVDKALEAWLDRQKSPKVSEKVPKKRKKSKATPKRRTEPPLEFVRPTIEGERYTPTRLVSRLRNQLRSYIEGAYPLSDPILVRARRKLLEEDQNGHLLSQQPYVETTPRYKTSDKKYGELGLPTHIATFFEQLAQLKQQHAKEETKTLLYPKMWTHQAKSFQTFLADEKDIIVATGTGSGKTECFLVPIIGSLFDEAGSRPDSFAMPGIRVLILYPMNALVNDQLSRLRLLLGDEGLANIFRDLGTNARHPTFGMYTGRTPYPGPRSATKDLQRVAQLLKYYTGMQDDLKDELQLLGRYPAKALEAFYAKELEEEAVYQTGKRAGKAYTKHHWKQRLQTQPGDRELLMRQEMVKGAGSRPGNAPDVLITNYSMLEYMLMRPFERPLFEQTAQWLAREGNQFLIVLDEAHMYRGAKGAEVGFLLRRLRARLGISERPDKLRVICTSASLGTDEKALNNIQKFAADLTGKKPDDFVPIIGQRDIPDAGGVPQIDLATVLAAIDLDDLHAVAAPDALAAALQPLFELLNEPCASQDEETVLAHLYDVLRDQPIINQLLKQTAGEAQSLETLAAVLFPGCESGKKMVEVLITLGTIARKEKGEPGLIPTRIHALFRGLNSLYACINSRCSGRQDSPGEKATLGKLFSQPTVSCDACGSRVFELASCRYCGSPYFLAYSPQNELQTFDFLWGETEGQLERIEILPSEPRHVDRTEEVRLHLRTGYLDLQNNFPDEQVQSIWLPLDSDGNRESSFQRCAMCQPPSSGTRSRISDFRTKGEQPFTALIEAQFSEQPPQKDDKRLPNQGRKVLVFSDGRQKAARLAPALEYSHARGLFRQVLALAAQGLVKETGFSGMDKLYPAVIWVCNTRGIDLFPSPDEQEFHDHLRRSRNKSLSSLVEDANVGYLRPTQSYAQHLFSEMTDKYYSLNSLGLATVEEDPLVRYILDDFPDVGLGGEESRLVFRTWLRQQLENRTFLPQGADISNLGEKWMGPQGIDATRESHVMPHPFEEYIRRIVESDTAFTAVKEWFVKLIRQSVFSRLENDRYFLQPLGLSLNLKLDAGWLRCRDCSRLYAETLQDLCPACLGEIVAAEKDYVDARMGFYQGQVRRAFDSSGLEPFGLTAAEHSAQLTGQDDEEAFNKTEKYELRFQDIPIEENGDVAPPIDVLSCTTTMEVGIDIGTLSGVALRNVPPHVANYQQRSGRAGRRGRSVASVITYAHGSTHDAHFYSHPEKIISGDVLAPIVYIENQQVLRRHINAFLVQRFFHETVTVAPEIYELFESLGTVEQFLSDEYPCSLAKLEAWLEKNQNALRDELRHWAPKYSYGLDEDIQEVGDTIDNAVSCLIKDLRDTLPCEAYSNREELEGVVREGLERQLEEKLLDTLIGRAIFPRYAFPTDVVGFWVSKRKARGDEAYKRSFDYEPQRDLQIALTEYAPGSSLTIDKYRFTSAAIYSPYAPEMGPTLDRARIYAACNNCGYVRVQDEAAVLPACPCCGGDDLAKSPFITPQGFAPDIHDKREVDRGDASVTAGRTTRAQLEVQEPPPNWTLHLFEDRLSIAARSQHLVTVNKGVGDRGFMVCPSCGRTEAVFGPGFPNSVMMRGGIPRQHRHPLEQGVFCDTRPIGPYYLGHRFPTDVLLLRLQFNPPMACGTADRPGVSGRPGRAALTSLVEAMCLAASRTLQIDEGELAGNWSPVLGGSSSEVYMFLYDLLPGGAGYTRLVKESLEEVLSATESILGSCTCESSCYQCLRHYSNNFIHPSLDRHLALSLLKYIVRGELPTLTSNEQQRHLDPLAELLQLKDIEITREVQRGTISVPMIVKRADGSEVWVNPHHPLLDPEMFDLSVREAADAELVEYCPIDAFSLRHDLPEAYRRLQV